MVSEWSGRCIEERELETVGKCLRPYICMRRNLQSRLRRMFFPMLMPIIWLDVIVREGASYLSPRGSESYIPADHSWRLDPEFMMLDSLLPEMDGSRNRVTNQWTRASSLLLTKLVMRATVLLNHKASINEMFLTKWNKFFFSIVLLGYVYWECLHCLLLVVEIYDSGLVRHNQILVRLT